MRLAVIGLLVLLGALLVVEVAYSLTWPIAHDEAPLLYQAFLMITEGRLPYRDLLDFQMPGAYAAFYALGVISRFDPLALRLLDLVLLALLSYLTFRWLRPFGPAPALVAPILFALKYLEGGPSMALQREFLLLLPVAGALLLYSRTPATPRRLAGIGVCFGLAALIKPHAAIALAPIALVDLWHSRGMGTGQLLRSQLSLLAGFLIPIAIAAVWMQATGTLAPFIDIATGYWPLYAEVNGQLVVQTGAARWSAVFAEFWRLGGHALWLVPAALGAIAAGRTIGSSQHRLPLLYGMALASAIYPALSGQFFQYHYIPFLYFIIALASLCLIPSADLGLRAATRLALLAVLAASVRLAPLVQSQLRGKPLAGGRATQIASYLQTHLASGETVQPLDWTGGALQAMLESRASLATSFVFDFYLYHHVSSPYIQGLRARLIDELEAAPPAYIVEVTAMDKPWIGGPDTSRDFPELRLLLSQAYNIEVRRDDYLIYRRLPAPP